MYAISLLVKAIYTLLTVSNPATSIFHRESLKPFQTRWLQIPPALGKRTEITFVSALIYLL